MVHRRMTVVWIKLESHFGSDVVEEVQQIGATEFGKQVSHVIPLRLVAGTTCLVWKSR